MQQDWYATLTTLVGVDPSDTARSKQDIDGVDVWPMITRANLTNPRDFLPVTSKSIIWQGRCLTPGNTVTVSKNSF